MARYFVIIITALLICSCSLIESLSKGEKVAQVGGVVLYKSDLEKVLPSGISKEDSIAFATQYINSWAMKQLMLLKAQDELPKAEKELAQLLEDYKAQLLAFRYENLFIEERLDTIVSVLEREEYYNSHLNIFLEKDGLVKGRLAKMHNSSPSLLSIKRLATKRDIESIEEFADIAYNSSFKYLDFFDTWMDLKLISKEIGIDLEDLQEMLKPNLRGSANINFKADLEIKDSLYTNFLQIYDYVAPGAAAPFEYNSEKIKEIIISRRKQDLLNKLHSDILKDGIENKKFKIIENEKGAN